MLQYLSKLIVAFVAVVVEYYSLDEFLRNITI